jgi:hypothetical protein
MHMPNDGKHRDQQYAHNHAAVDAVHLRTSYSKATLGIVFFEPFFRDDGLSVSDFRAAVLWLSGAPASGQERGSTDFIVPLGYCRLTSTPSLNSSATYTANQREGASPPLARS